MKKAFFTFGRFNPVTVGHEKLWNAAKRQGSDYRIYVSKSQDRKKNPLDYKSKIKFMRKIFPGHAKHIIDSPARTALDVAVDLYDEGYTDILMIAGSDRVGEFKKLLDKYNGIKKQHGLYKFDSIEVVSAGERDPDAAGASGMSASKMSGAATDNNFDLFKTGLPDTLKDSDAKALFKTLQKAMGIKSFSEWAEVEEGPFGRLVKSKAYQVAAKYFQQFVKQGHKPAIALHKAAGTVKGVNDRDLQMYLTKLKLL